MSQKRKAIITGLLAGSVMIVIFLFSCQSAEASTEVSYGLLQHILTWFRRVVEPLAGRTLTDIELEIVLRKIGHFTEFAALGFFVMLHLQYSRRQKKLLCSWGLATVYAVTDELHQFFSEGRGPSVTDVCIDSCGALTGAALLLLLAYLAAMRRKA